MKIIQNAEGIEIGDFDPVEALKVAMKIENDGITFYLKARDIMEDESAKAVFDDLIKEEDDHLHMFKNMLEEFIHENKLDIEIESGAEEEFFDSIATSVFGDILDIEKDVKHIKGALEAIRFAQRIEINSFNFYKALLTNTSSPSAQEIIKKIISEEQHHLKTFLEYEKKLN